MALLLSASLQAVGKAQPPATPTQPMGSGSASSNSGSSSALPPVHVNPGTDSASPAAGGHVAVPLPSPSGALRFEAVSIAFRNISYFVPHPKEKGEAHWRARALWCWSWPCCPAKGMHAGTCSRRKGAGREQGTASHT